MKKDDFYEVNNIKQFLEPTVFCDFENPLIQKKVREIKGQETDTRKISVKLFEWVRDRIFYLVGNWQKKASETLKTKKGTCTNKANLLVAFFRTIGVPAGYGIMKVYTRYFGPLFIPMFKKFSGKISTHIYCVAWLNNKWVKCDPSDDKRLSENTFYLNPQSKLVEWDGINDATLNLNKEDILEDRYPIANIDFWMFKKAKHAKGIPLKVANLFIEFLRENTEKVSNVKEIEILFKKWLNKKYPFYFYSFSILNFLKRQKKSN
ncbi:MAG: transglutaminase-like domain-containing protein [Minisyncoccia bacterium]